MRPSKAVVFILLAMLPPVYAQLDAQASRADIVFSIQPDNSVVQTTQFTFAGPLSGGSVNYTLNTMVRGIVVEDAGQRLEYRLGPDGTLEIFLKGRTSMLKINYIADNVVFRSGDVNQFFTEFSFEQPLDVAAQVKLPAGFGLYEDSYRPAGASTISDGRRIILAWNLSDARSVFFSVKFTQLQESSLPIAVSSLFAGVAIFLFLYFRQKTKEEFIKGFREDEKRVVEYLQERGQALQSDLQKEFHFSRAKATRIVMHLEQKGLLRKQRYGRTNRLFWLK